MQARGKRRFAVEGAVVLSLAVPGAMNLRRRAAPAISKAVENYGNLLLEHRLDGDADVRPKAILDRVDPGLVTQQRPGRGVRSMGHGVVPRRLTPPVRGHWVTRS